MPLATEATGPPLLLVHPAGGTVLAYAELGQALAGAMPVYGLQAQGMEPGQAPLDQVEQMAEAYIEAARRELRPEVWRLAGWSFGAVVAFEMARQLQAAGEIVATPIALDAPASHTPPPAAEADIIQRVIRMYGEMLALQPAGGSGNEEAADRLERMVDAAVASGIFPADFGAAPARRLAAVIAGCFRAGEAYQAGPAPIGVNLIRAADNPIRVEDDRLGWGALAEGGVNLKFVPGGHTTMLRAPCVAGLAAAISACILPHSQMGP